MCGDPVPRVETIQITAAITTTAKAPAITFVAGNGAGPAIGIGTLPDSSAIATSCPDRNRRSGSFSRQCRTIEVGPGGKSPGAVESGSVGRSAAIVSGGDALWNAGRPDSISNTIAPNEKTSVR